MKDALGIIYTSKDDLSLRELTAHRSIAALPVAGRYRIVDFLLSNMVNSGVRNVGVITQRNYRSLMDHLGAGKEWDLHTRNNGLFILPPSMEVLRARLLGRSTDSPEAAQKRLNEAIREIGCAKDYDYVIVNDDLDRAVEDVCSVIRAARLRSENMKETINEVLEHA